MLRTVHQIQGNIASSRGRKVATQLVLLVATLILTAAHRASARTQPPCSRVCPCMDNSVFCAGMGYSKLPKDIRKDVTHINFQENLLTEIRGSTLKGYSSLQRLLLSANRIEHVAKNAFRPVRRLASLDLSLNRLSLLPGGTLAPLRHLAYLDLAHNNISSADGLVDGLHQLRTLSLQNNRLFKVSEATFAGASGLRYIDLSGNALVALSEDAFSRLKMLTHLLLNHNNLGIAHQHNGTLRLAIKSPYMRQLGLRNCSLARVPDMLPRSLIDLDIAENRITSVERSHFARLERLASLDMSYNFIDSINGKAFRNNPRLERLQLQSNRIVDLPSLPESLVILRLEDNAVEVLERSTLARNGRLQELGLGQNVLRRVHPAALANLTRLRTLTLNRNFVAHLPSKVFANLSKLMNLDLSDNPLEDLPDGIFDGLPSLDSLKLCRLRQPMHVSAPIFRNARALRILDLDGSPAIAAATLAHDLRQYSLRGLQYLNLMRANLSTLYATFPQYLPSARTLQLSDNPWRCDRALYWMQNWLLAPTSTPPIQHREHIRCATPRELAGKRLVDLRPRDWTSQDRQSRGTGSAMASSSKPLGGGNNVMPKTV